MFSSDLPEIDQSVRASIAGMLGRPLPDEVATKDAIFKQYVPLSLLLVVTEMVVSEQLHL